MCDDTGLLQHAVCGVPDRSHGYCIDDNARALLLACALNASGEQALPEPVTVCLAAFVQHAWNPAAKRFRNFLSYDRRWLEEAGSEDSHGRALWALGECVHVTQHESQERIILEVLFEHDSPSKTIGDCHCTWRDCHIFKRSCSPGTTA